jgi:hydroxymethylglutaryl-CoA lyase
MTKADVIIREVALRDGLQSEAGFVATKDKLSLITDLAEAGVTCLETTSFVSPKAVFQLCDAAEVMARARRGHMLHEVMVPNAKGARAAVEARADRIIVFVSASETHNLKNVGCSIERSLSEIKEISQIAYKHDTPVAAAIATAFGCPYQGRINKSDVLDIARRFVDQGADRITLADTTGMANPVQICQVIRFFKKQLPETTLCLHLHNNRGIAAANLYAGFLSGIRMFDTSLGGIGGCPNVPRAAGNLATEDIVSMFESMGIKTGIDLNLLICTALKLEKILGHPLPGQVMKSGPAF